MLICSRNRPYRVALQLLNGAILVAILMLGTAAMAQSSSAVLPNYYPSLAVTPPMGWASWNHFFCDYDERTIRSEADALVSNGMRDAGYRYVVIQECIARDRDAKGNLIPDSVRFPSGVKALVDYIHARGLKAGIYTDIGKHTCYPNPQYQGSYGHEEQDANTFAAWGIDFVEMDYCNREHEHTGRYVYEKMAAAIRATGRPMIFYLCCWGNEQPWEWAQGKAQMWRTEFDISLEKNHVQWQRLVGNFESNTVHSVFSAPGSWNDADMLEIGNPGLSETEARAQFSMWAISPSPLLAGADLTQINENLLKIYANREVIAIDQDSLGAGAVLASRGAPGIEVWQRPLGSWTGGEFAVLMLNASDQAASMNFLWTSLNLKSVTTVRDVWMHRNLPSDDDGISQVVEPHSAVLLRVSGLRDWTRAVRLEAETPSNLRVGNATLFTCGECSRGYAVSVGGDNSHGAITFAHIQIKHAGVFRLYITYVRNGLEDKMFDLTVNGGEPTKIRAIMRSWNTFSIPARLRAGENTISVGYQGDVPFNLDYIELTEQ